MRTVIGLEKFLTQPQFSGWRKAPLGFLANQASVGRDYVHGLALFDEKWPGAVKALFGPQHGWAGEKQDNMVESDHMVDGLGRPIYSLYGETRRPKPEMLKGLAALVVDLVDVGTRVYTFAHTLTYCLEECARYGVEVIVLDRPNPIGGASVEGNLLAADCESFVGLHPVPMRHGFTMGELARFVNSRLAKPAELTVITCDNWERRDYFPETGLPWVYPSPNMPGFECAWVYPGQVIWEGTNISEGRGTTRPFNLVGAPFIRSEELCRYLRHLDLPGVIFRPAHFEPTFHKWAGEMCRGVELFPIAETFRPYLTALSILEAILNLWPEHFRLKEPPYEYEYERRPLDLILGRKDIFDRLVQGEKAADLALSWQGEESQFLVEREKFLLY